MFVVFGSEGKYVSSCESSLKYTARDRLNWSEYSDWQRSNLSDACRLFFTHVVAKYAYVRG